MADNDNTESIGSSISGTEKAAIFMMSLGEEAAADVLKYMDPKQVQSVGTAMATLENISNAKVDSVLQDFTSIIREQSGVGADSDEYIRKMLTNALGEDKAESVIDRILLGKNAKGLDSLKWMDPRAVADVVKNEHPQIMAIVMSYLEPDHAAEVLKHLQDRMQADVLMRIASLEGVPPVALAELNEVLEKQFSGSSSVQSAGVGGVKTAADILNFMDGASEESITEAITEQDADLCQAIQDQMFVFENLMDVEDRGIQTILREVQSESLILALKGADKDMQDKIFKNMSERAAEMMKDDLEAKGPVKLSEVEAAQKEILSVAKRLADSGEIHIGGQGGDEEYV